MRSKTIQEDILDYTSILFSLMCSLGLNKFISIMKVILDGTAVN